jgi:hypothetical protein
MQTNENKATIFLNERERFDLECKICFLMSEFDGEIIHQPHRLQAKALTYALWLLDHRWSIHTMIDDLALLVKDEDVMKKSGRSISNLIRFLNEIKIELLIERR